MFFPCTKRMHDIFSSHAFGSYISLESGDCPRDIGKRHCGAPIVASHVSALTVLVPP